MASEPQILKPAHSRKRIAIVGGGVSGISCLWTLRQRDDYEVHLFEADDRLGGHANSVPFENNGVVVNVDTGFIAMNEETYPNFNKFLEQLGVETIPTDMSFGVSVNRGQYEWGSRSLGSFIGQWSNLLRPWFWRLCFDILRFNITSPDILTLPVAQHNEDFVQGNGKSRNDAEQCPEFQTARLEPIGAYLSRMNYSKNFADLFLIPMVAAPWCINPDEFSKNFPAKFLIDFMAHHRLLDTVWHTLRWRTFPNGSKAYVDAFIKTLPPNHHIHLNRRIERIKRGYDSEVSVLSSDGSSVIVDHVVLAVHANQALRMLDEEASKLETSLLSAFKTTKNTCILHSDTSVLPRRRKVWSAWNCSISKERKRSDKAKFASSYENSEHDVAITFDMNRLQCFPPPNYPSSPGHVLVTMNSPRPIPNAQGAYTYYHPLFTSDSVQASQHLHRINGVHRVSFAGAWMGYGFHEDGFVAGSQAARNLLARDGVKMEEGQQLEMEAVVHNKHRNKWLVLVIQIVQFFIDLQMFLFSKRL